MNIYSRISPTHLLHIITRGNDIPDGRVDLCDPGESLQIATLKQPAGTTYRAHKHISHQRAISHTQETWIIIKGLVQVVLYDIDDTVLHTDVLGPGDLSCTLGLGAGHNYTWLQPGLVYEVKAGAFTGVDEDKKYINQTVPSL